MFSWRIANEMYCQRHSYPQCLICWCYVKPSVSSFPCERRSTGSDPFSNTILHQMNAWGPPRVRPCQFDPKISDYVYLETLKGRLDSHGGHRSQRFLEAGSYLCKVQIRETPGWTNWMSETFRGREMEKNLSARFPFCILQLFRTLILQ